MDIHSYSDDYDNDCLMCDGIFDTEIAWVNTCHDPIIGHIIRARGHVIAGVPATL